MHNCASMNPYSSSPPTNDCLPKAKDAVGLPKSSEPTLPKHDSDEEDGNGPNSLESSSSSGSWPPFYQVSEEESAFKYLRDSDGDSLTKQLKEFLQVLPNMNRESILLRNQLDRLRNEIDEVLACQPSSSESSLCGEDHILGAAGLMNAD